MSEVAKVTSGGTPSRQKTSYWNGKIPWVTTSLIAFNRIGEALEFISEEGLANSAAKLFPKGTLIMALYGQGVTRGKVAILDFEATTNQACAALLIERHDVDTEFLFYELQRRYEELRSLSNDGGQKNLSGDLVKNLRITLPTLPEQQKIADFLTAVDKRINQLIQKKALLEDYKKGVMQQLFSQAIRFKDDHGNDFPDWEEKDLKEIASPMKKKNRDMAVNLVLTNSATQGIISQRDYFDKDIANQKNIGGYYVVGTDDFVYNPRISETAPVGPIKRNHIGTGVMSPLYTVFRMKEGDATFFEFYFQTNEWHEYMNSVANFGARHDRMAITTGDFYSLPLPFPSLPEQTKIANFLSAIDRKIEQVTTQITQTQTFKRGLLQQMFV